MTEEQVQAFTNSMWLAMTKAAYAMAVERGEDKLKYRYTDEIARSLLEHFPNSAHLYALEQINTVGELQIDMWRQVLTELDKLEAQNELRRRTMGADISRREDEPHGARQDASREDGGQSWGQGAPSGVDESA